MDIQSIAAIIVVFATIILMALRIKRKKGACGTGHCGCSETDKK